MQWDLGGLFLDSQIECELYLYVCIVLKPLCSMSS